VKICCISSLEEARLAIACGASALGLVSAMPSGPGVIGDDLIARIAAEVPPPVATFLLTSRQDADGIIRQHRRCRTSTIQLVDHVPAADLRKVRQELPGIRLVQVIHVRNEESIDEALAMEGLVDAQLLDSGNPALAVKVLGGTGKVHDWTLSRRIVEASRLPVFLAGGLNPGNVAQAVALVRPFGVDLCSGVRRYGKLNATKLEMFFAALRGGA
jgi:phosphoribosylanthranilate isomerase